MLSVSVCAIGAERYIFVKDTSLQIKRALTGSTRIYMGRKYAKAWRAACARAREKRTWWKHWLRVARAEGMPPWRADHLREKLLDAQTYMHLSDCSVHAVVAGDHTVTLIELWYWTQQTPYALEHARKAWQSEAACSVTRARWLWQQLTDPLACALARIRAVFDNFLEPFVMFGVPQTDAKLVFDVLAACHHAARLGSDGVNAAYSASARARRWHEILPLVDILSGNNPTHRQCWGQSVTISQIAFHREQSWRSALDTLVLTPFRLFRDLFAPAPNEHDTVRACRLVYPFRNGALRSDVRVTTHGDGNVTYLAFNNYLNKRHFPRSQLPIARIEELYAENENTDADTVVTPCPWTPQLTYWEAIRQDIDIDLKCNNSSARLMYAHGRLLILDNPALPTVPMVLLDEKPPPTWACTIRVRPGCEWRCSRPCHARLMLAMAASGADVPVRLSECFCMGCKDMDYCGPTPV
jgi:hypothetical protein